MKKSAPTLNNAKAVFRHSIGPEQFLADSAVERTRALGKPTQTFIAQILESDEAAKQSLESGRGLLGHDS
ncbi:hypothetical protein [Synechococcus sp. MU1642]|uniref:hypothetical protein n=1 Tax=Synechococcus sp. MU1642 TaxID=2508348 RepID=UPI001CF8D13F|nr:hypothetical protein [Synechococcus sp. MU1642]